MSTTGKVSIGSYPLIYPIPVVLVGANVAGHPNYETIGNCSIAGFGPGLVFISSVKTHYTNRGILENQTFGVSIPTVDMCAVVDFCGIASGRDYDKGALFETFYGQLGTAPMIRACPVTMECRVIQNWTHGSMDMFIGEVVDVYADEPLTEAVEEARSGSPDLADPSELATTRGLGGAAVGRRRRLRAVSLAQLKPLLFHHDNNYYTVGDRVGRGYHDGREVAAPRRGKP